MSTRLFPGSVGVFGDQVYSSTDLNRRAGEVLDDARKRPVTISRNREQFALLKREQVAELVRTALQFGPTIDLIQGALNVVEGEDPPVSLAWLEAFKPDDLRKMIREVLVASNAALRGTGDWDAVDAIVHEWRESAAVAMSGVIDEALKTPPDEFLPLTDPRLMLEGEP